MVAFVPANSTHPPGQAKSRRHLNPQQCLASALISSAPRTPSPENTPPTSLKQDSASQVLLPRNRTQGPMARTAATLYFKTLQVVSSIWSLREEREGNLRFFSQTCLLHMGEIKILLGDFSQWHFCSPGLWSENILGRPELLFHPPKLLSLRNG